MSKKSTAERLESLQKRMADMKQEEAQLKRELDKEKRQAAKRRRPVVGALVESILGPIDTPEKMARLKEMLNKIKPL